MASNDQITYEGDLVLIYYQEKPVLFARVESIEPDIKRGWFQITLLLLTIPTQVVTWILRDAYINGEVFTMGGDQMRLEKVHKVTMEKRPPDREDGNDEKSAGTSGTVIPFKRDN